MTAGYTRNFSLISCSNNTPVLLFLVSLQLFNFAMSDKQRTIQKPVSVSGVGLHTGRPVTLTFNPAPENHWFKFQRTDLEGHPVIDADADLVVDTSRGTTLE